MKKLSIILFGALLVLAACTKSKEVHPELGDGNDEIVTVGMKDVHVEYTRTDHAELQKVVFHYSLSETQQFTVAEMTKRETFFELTLNDLLSDTLYSYYYELFPNNGDAFITSQKTFHTQAFETPEPPTPPSGILEGAIDGPFTINLNGDKVYFSQGNLQYQASTNTWKFAENQWNQVGGQFYEGEIGNVYENGVKCDNMLVSATYSGWIDMFCWGTSGWDCGNTYYMPYDKDGEGEQYGPMGYSTLTDEFANSDWGVYNAIANGGDQPGLWRTLSDNEWNFIMSHRTNAEQKYSLAVVNGIHGCILLPDEWICPTGLSFVPQSFDWTTNVYSEVQWTLMELNGAVFLPASGFRNPNALLNYDCCIYQTVNSGTDYGNISFFISVDGGYIPSPGHSRVLARSVRLVHDAN